MRDDRRRFLRVFGATAVGLALPACGSAVDSNGSVSRVVPTGAGGSGGGGAGGEGGAGGAGGCENPPSLVVAGPPSAFAADGLHTVPNTKVLIGRDADGIYALSALCTHSFCNLNNFGTMGPDGADCSCHGSEFNVDGTVKVGPAKLPLAHFLVSLGCDGTLLVDMTTTVASDTRLMA